MNRILSIIFIILGIAALLYGICMRAARTGTMFFAVWLGIGVFLLLLGIAGRTALWPALPAVLRFLVYAVLVAALVTVGVCCCLIATDFHSKGPDDLDAIIVLGAQVKKSGPSTVLRYRLDTACDYLEEHPGVKCVVSGGQGYNEPETEAECMKKYLADRGIPAARIIKEDRSASTVQNLEFSKKYIDIENDRIGIVTNNFHVFRSVHIAERSGYRHVFGMASGSKLLNLPNNMLRETAGILKDKLAGNL
ncbi:MAG: ElyC/SanA/YdcF family protein [Anaerovoracaceae bacterium]|nr:ElyC/SanA/YdcF family protein [Bacillota bacterium]MDY2671059.1 ElyC/SanA/YdcF family protein [Anaerovoracaceae bacterium]